jgi:glutamate formiminotransferase / 5-formyltetrahydrofolate cyclo-ligase
MTARVLEAVPNFSEGRDLTVVRAIVDAMRRSGAELLDWSADPDHNRSVVTVIGTPAQVEAAAFAGAAVAVERIDLRRHTGVHPRIGAIDVLPFVPLAGLNMDEVTESARRVGRRLASELRLPVFFYGYASDPPGRDLAALRRGGFEMLAAGWPDGRKADLLPEDWPHPGGHPTAGACCVGSRRILLAWNIWVSGIGLGAAREIAREVRQSSGGIRGVRALALALPSRNALQVSMNLEDVQNASPADVFRRVRAMVQARGGDVDKTEVIGMIPDQLVATASPDELRLDDFSEDRLLSRRLAQYVAKHRDSAQA